MKKSFLLLCVLLLTACGDDQVDLPDERLNGRVDGSEWSYKFGNAYLASGTLNYTLRLLSTSEVGEDPCPFISSTNPYLQVTLPLRVGNYVLPLTPFSDNFKFVHGNGVVLSATSGFVEIVGIENGRVIGFIQASFDEENEVAGTFDLRICS